MKKIRGFFGSLIFRLIIIISLIGILPAVVVQAGLLTNYERRAVSVKTIEILNQAKILANTIVAENYIESPENALIDAELAQFSNIYDGRVMIVDQTFRIVKDTYDLDTRKTIISREVMQSFRGEEVTNYDSENRYIELIVPLTPQITETEEVPDTLPILGAMVVSVSTDSDAYNYDFLKDRGLILLIAMSMAVVLLAVLLAIQQSVPLRRLSSAVRHLRTGVDIEELQPQGYSEVKEIADEINHMTASVKALNDSRQEFVSNVSHELKTPLTSMKVLADSLNGQENVPVELYQEFMSDITEEIDRENQIITDLLSLVKMDKASADLTITSVNINDLLELIMKRLRPIADRQNVELVLESFRPIVAEIDETKLTLAISNLVENGIKYNQPEGGYVHVSLNADHQYFYVTVEDSGIGIPEEAQEHIYERFYRVDKSHSRAIGGTGLGLAITRSAILMHRGSIKVFSKEGEGTTFTVRIPLNYIVRTS